MNRIWQVGVGVLLTAMAGYVDALGFVRLGGLYTSFMSGNTTQLAVVAAKEEVPRLALPAALIGAFVLGSTFGSLVAILAPQRWSTPVVLACEAALMLLALWLGLRVEGIHVASVVLAGAMGSQNAVLAQVKHFRAGTTFVTGALFSFSQKVAQALTRTGDPLGWMGDAVVWLSLLVGAFLGGLAYDAFGLYALVAPASVAALLALVSAALVALAGPAPAEA